MFTILADETSSAAKEFITIAVRYVDEKCLICEAFLGFQNVSETTGETLCLKIVDMLKETDIELSSLIGQGYDGAANMAGHKKGVQSRMKQMYPLADYYHCSSHKLNLVATDAATVVPIKHFLSRVQDILVFFDGSPKRMDILRKMINQMLPETRKERIQQIGPTCWVDRHRTLVSFGELFLPITATLQQLSETDNDRIAKDLINGITTFDSIFSLNVWIKVAGILKHLAVILQTESMDLIAAHKEICLTSTLIKEAIDETKFNELYTKSKSMADDMGITVAFPNREKRLRKDNLNDQSSVKAYYKEKVHDAYLLKILAELGNRFSNDQLVAFKFQYFLPDHAASLSYDAVSEALMKYGKFFNKAKEKSVVEPELRRWQGRVQNCPKGSSVSDILAMFAGDTTLRLAYPTVFMALKLLATLPVMTASVER